MPIGGQNLLVPPLVYLDATNLARTMARVMIEMEGCKKLGDTIKYAKKCGAYDFLDTLDPGQADKWAKMVEKSFIMLWLNDEEKVGNVYSLMFNRVDDRLTSVKNLFRETFTL